MRKTEEWLKELPAPLNEWALSQMDKNWEGWRDECFSLQRAITCFAGWHKTKEGWRYWYDVEIMAVFNELHEHPDVVAYKERPKLNPEYHDEGKRKTLTNQEKYLQMEGKQENQLQMKKSIRYKDVAELGFERRVECDKVFEDEYGVPYMIVTKKLTKTIYIDWDQIERTCEMYRIDNKRDCNVVGRMPIQGLDHLKAMIKFFEK